jgi:hypothetical protein
MNLAQRILSSDDPEILHVHAPGEHQRTALLSIPIPYSFDLTQLTRPMHPLLS